MVKQQVQFGAAASSLGLVLLSASFMVFTRHDIIHSLVLAWALFALGIALHDPERKGLPFDAAGKPSTLALGIGAWINCVAILLLAFVGACWAIARLMRGAANEHLLRHYDMSMESSLTQHADL